MSIAVAWAGYTCYYNVSEHVCVTDAWGRMHLILCKVKLADVYNRCQGSNTPCIAVAKGRVHVCIAVAKGRVHNLL